MSGQDSLQRWLDLAFDSVAAQDATAAIAHHRTARDEAGFTARSYEVQVAPDAPLLETLTKVLPRFRAHMESLRLAPLGGPGVFLSVFVGERLYFIAPDATERLHASLAANGQQPLLPAPRW